MDPSNQQPPMRTPSAEESPYWQKVDEFITQELQPLVHQLVQQHLQQMLTSDRLTSGIVVPLSSRSQRPRSHKKPPR
jgi:hypothetical protein